MKKVITVLEIIVLIFILGSAYYLNNNLKEVKEINNTLSKEVSTLEENLSNDDSKINDLNTQISESSTLNEDKVKEYEKWIRHKDKLKTLLGY